MPPMKTIWKFPLKVADGPQEIYVPIYAELIEVHHQDEDIALWFIVDTDVNYELRRTFRVYGTGWEMDKTEVLDHLDSVHVNGYVWHVFEVQEGRIVGTRRHCIDGPDFKELLDSGKWRPRDNS